MKLSVILPDRRALDAEAAALTAEDASGVFGIRPGHEPMMTALVPSLLSYEGSDGAVSFVALDGGLLVTDGDSVEVFTRDAHAGSSAREAHEKALAEFKARAAADLARRNAIIKMQIAAFRMLFGYER